MACRPNQPVRVGVLPVTTPHPTLPKGAVLTRYQGTASCGWSSSSIGTEAQATGWARRHASEQHSASELLPCKRGEHLANKRTGWCLYCGQDTWTPQRREAWATAAVGAW